MIEKLRYNFCVDLKKREIDSYERAKIIRSEMDSWNPHLSVRGFAKKFNIPSSTVFDWLLPLNLEEDEFKNLEKKVGPAKTMKLLRDKKASELSKKPKIDIEIANAITVFRRYLNHPEFTPERFEELKELRNIISRILMKLEKKYD